MRPWYWLWMLLLVAVPVSAHKLAPSLLQLTQLDNAASQEQWQVSWKTPRFGTTPVPIQPQLPQGCEDTQERSWEYEGTGVRIEWQMRCVSALAGSSVRVDGLAENQSSALIRVQWLGGAVAQGVMNGVSPEYVIPEQPGALGIAFDYTVLGIEHILSGPDHLLFVLGLLLLATTTRLLIWTITAFTLGHSVTLALAALGYVTYPVDLVEFAIALSIFVVAVELTREPSATHWLRRRPWLAAGSFGLLHGMGFAGALLEVGLPLSDIPLALLTFNVGIELGQLMFVMAVLIAGWCWKRLPAAQLRERLVWVPVYTIGIPSVYWCIERGLATIGMG